MKIREFRESDVEPINEIWEKHHSKDCSLPDRRNSVVDAVVENDEGKIIGYGQVKLFAEAMMFLDHSIADLQKAEAIRLLIMEAIAGTREARLGDVYAFIKDPEFARLLQKHFDFEAVEYPGDLFLRRL